jgi:hypothetical protein
VNEIKIVLSNYLHDFFVFMNKWFIANKLLNSEKKQTF